MGLKDWKTSFLGTCFSKENICSLYKKGVLPPKQSLPLENNAHVRDDAPIFSSEDDQCLNLSGVMVDYHNLVGVLRKN